MTLQYRPSTSVSPDGTAQLLVRFNTSRHTSFRAKSRIFVPVEHFDITSQHILLPKRVTPLTRQILDLNQDIDALSAHIYQTWNRDRFASNPPSWLQSTIDSYSGITPTLPTTIQNCVLQYADEHTSVPNTYKNILTLARSVQSFRPDTPICSITPDFVREYAAYLSTTIAPNTVKKMLSTLRTVCKRAVFSDILTRSPFEGPNAYHIGQPVYGSPQYLTVQERDYLTTFPDLPPKLAIQRDIFIFQCHTGCRVSDLIALTPANLFTDTTGQQWLHYIPKKTIAKSATAVRVPLSATALAIIARYRHTHLVRGISSDTKTYFAEYLSEPSFIADKLLPCISAQKYNNAIHDIFVIANLNRPILIIDRHTGKPTTTTLDTIATSHLARKTFSQSIYATTHSDRITASFTGHSPNSRAFLRYNEVDDATKLSTIQSINQQNS